MRPTDTSTHVTSSINAFARAESNDSIRLNTVGNPLCSSAGWSCCFSHFGVTLHKDTVKSITTTFTTILPAALHLWQIFFSFERCHPHLIIIMKNQKNPVSYLVTLKPAVHPLQIYLPVSGLISYRLCFTAMNPQLPPSYSCQIPNLASHHQQKLPWVLLMSLSFKINALLIPFSASSLQITPMCSSAQECCASHLAIHTLCQ